MKEELMDTNKDLSNNEIKAENTEKGITSERKDKSEVTEKVPFYKKKIFKRL